MKLVLVFISATLVGGSLLAPVTLSINQALCSLFHISLLSTLPLYIQLSHKDIQKKEALQKEVEKLLNEHV